MALTQISTGGIKDTTIATADIADDAVTSAKIADGTIVAANIANDSITAVQLANNSADINVIVDGAVSTAKIADQAVTLAKLPHGDGSSNGKFLRANNGADPTFETVNTDLVADTSPQLGGNLASNGNDILMGDNDEIKLGAGGDLKLEHQSSSGDSLITEVGGGDLIIQGSDIIIRDAGTAEKHIEMTQNGSVDLYHNGSKKLTTNTTGIDINTGGSDLGSSLKIYGNDVIKRSNWGYSSSYRGIIIGRTDSNVNSSIFMGVDPSGNTSGAFGGYGNEMIFRNDLSFYLPNNANNGWKTFMRLGQFSDTGAVRFNNGLGFGSDTATANILDDYEEGIFTPAWNGGSAGVSSISYGTTNAGSYTKVGRMVTVTGRTDISSVSGGGGFWYIGNMPFNLNSGGKGFNAVGSVSLENTNFANDTTYVIATMEQNNNNMHLHTVRDNAGLGTGVSPSNGAMTVQFTITYQTA